MVLLVALLALSGPIDRIPQSSSVSRACPNGWSAPPLVAKKAAKKASKELQNPGACIELAFSSLEIQEFQQSYARSKRWALFDELMTEDSWTFSLGLNKEDLLTATKTAPESNRVEWRSGVAIVQIGSAPSSDGFTRTIIRATFRGYGESADRFAPQKAYWDLATNGSFEAALVSALVAHFKPAS